MPITDDDSGLWRFDQFFGFKFEMSNRRLEIRCDNNNKMSNLITNIHDAIEFYEDLLQLSIQSTRHSKLIEKFVGRRTSAR